MKIALLIAFLALGVAGCQTSSPNSGAPASGYETSSGEGQGPAAYPNSAATNYPGGQWERWRYPGMSHN